MALTPSQLVLVSVVLWVGWRFVRHLTKKNIWDNVPGPIPHSFFTGDLEQLFHRHEGWGYMKRLEEIASVVHLRGLLGARIHVSFRNQSALRLPRFSSPLTGYKFQGAQHRRQRKVLNTVFSTENMRKMTPMFYELSRKLRCSLSELVKSSSKEIDVVHWMGRAALEFVAQGGMGHSFDSLQPYDEDKHVVGKAMKTLGPLLFALHFWRLASEFLQELGPPNFRRKLADLLVSVFPDKNLGRMRDVIDTLDDAARTIYNERLVSIAKQNDGLEERSEGTDVLSMLLKANERSGEGEGLSEAEILAQMSTMLFAGTDTTSNALGRILQALAEHPDVQSKVRDELKSARDYRGQDIPYDELVGLPLLDAACRETLRLYSPITVVPRQTITDIVLPLEKPICGVDGNMISELPIPKGTLLMPSYLSCNTSKAIWGDDASEWRPQRWLSPLPATVLQARIPGVYSNLMTFGGGPRSCIGFRFSQLEMKVVLSVLLEHFSFSLTGRKIFWNLSGISYPTMDESSIEPSLYLKVEALDA
ncbi:hypothetical protein NM688_g212 [Phlebia brevispora]|uniref:Uncharacterized protein n=1 Tax=Phlebia brevispora TaxID=194682 RepID=A0ACC1TFA0_9APHY|nr:hypothetical protein NM688_g212 [Phlebia brevispora]